MNITLGSASICRCFSLALALLFSLTFIASNRASAAEILLRHDTIPVGGSNNPLTQFQAGERVASWHISSVNGDLVGVQIQWDSLFGGAPPSQEFAVNIYAGGIFPTPGPLLAQISLPILLEASNNEMRHLNPLANTVPLQVPVTPGQTFVVALEFLNTNAGNLFAPSIEFDQDGIQPGVNAVFAIPGGWLAAGPQGVTGDFGIRAIINQIPEPNCLLLLSLGIVSPWLTGRRRSEVR